MPTVPTHSLTSPTCLVSPPVMYSAGTRGYCRSLLIDLDTCLEYFPVPWAEKEVHPGHRKLAQILLIVLASLPVSLPGDLMLQ